jgi:hypothetical protein
MQLDKANRREESIVSEDALTEVVGGNTTTKKIGTFARTELGKSFIAGAIGVAVATGTYRAAKANYQRRHPESKAAPA